LRGEYDQAKGKMEASLRMFETLGDEMAAIWPLLELGLMSVMQADYSDAQAHFEAALQVSKENDWARPIVKATKYLGNLATFLGEFQQAREYLLPSLRLADELGLIRDMINILYDIALTEAALGDQVSAI
jgi:tetratricopeptide (TPR) repeat protein